MSFYWYYCFFFFEEPVPMHWISSSTSRKAWRGGIRIGGQHQFFPTLGTWPTVSTLTTWHCLAGLLCLTISQSLSQTILFMCQIFKTCHTCTCFVFSFVIHYMLCLLRWTVLLLFGKACWITISRGWCLLPDTRADWTQGGSDPPRRGGSSHLGWRVWRGMHSPPLPHLPSGQIVVTWLRLFLSGSV